MVLSGSNAALTGANTVQIAEPVNTGCTNPWSLTGTASHAGSTYNVYTNVVSNNAQLLIDQKIGVSYVVL